MKTRQRARTKFLKGGWLLGVLVIISVGRFLSAPPGEESQEKKGLFVLATVLPLYEFAASLAGEKLTVELWLPPGSSPHYWQPRASDLRGLERADVLVYIGASLEPWVPDLLRSVKNQNLKVVSFEDLAFLRDEEKPEEVDPHIWLDFSLDLQIIDRLASTFSQLRPELDAHFAAKAVAYKNKLIELDRLYQQTISSCKQRLLIIAGHAAFSYLARRYGLEQVSLEGINPEAEARPKQLSRVLEIIEKKKIKAIFFDAASRPRLPLQLFRRTELKFLPLYSGHNLGAQEKAGQKSFLDLMRENLERLKEGLGCE